MINYEIKVYSPNIKIKCFKGQSVIRGGHATRGTNNETGRGRGTRGRRMRSKYAYARF